MAGLFGLHTGLGACAGIEVNIKAEGVFDVRLVTLSLEKNQVQIQSKKTWTAGPDKILKDVLDMPVAITLTGRGVLIKKTPKLEVINEQNLQHLFPNFKMADFYVQHFKGGDNSFIAIVRRDIADGIIDLFESDGVEVLMLSLGPFVADQIIPQINIYEGALDFDGHRIVLDPDNRWQDYVYIDSARSGFALKIDLETMPENYIVAYGTAFQLMLNDTLDLIEVESETVKTKLDELKAGLKFKKHGSVILFFFFIALMVNFLLLSIYSKNNQELMGRAGQQSNQFANKQKLTEDVLKKESIVGELGWNKGFSYAYLCDQIGQTVPSSVILEELTVNSLSGGVTGILKERERVPETGSLRIKGEAGSVNVVNDWMYALKDKSWVKDVRLEKYATDNQKETQVFTILLNY